MDTFGKLIGTSVETLVKWTVVPVADAIPRLISSGMALVLFGAAWIGFGIALVANPAMLVDASRSIGQLPLPLQAIVWLLFLPVMAGLWVWGTDWPGVARLVLIAGIAGWNLLMFLPRADARLEAGLEA